MLLFLAVITVKIKFINNLIDITTTIKLIIFNYNYYWSQINNSINEFYLRISKYHGNKL